MGFKPVYDENVPNYLKLTQKVASARNLRTNTIKEFLLMLISNQKLLKNKPGIKLTN